MNLRSRRIVLGLIVALFFSSNVPSVHLLESDTAWARAGGGHSYKGSSGGRSGGGSRSRGSSSGGGSRSWGSKSSSGSPNVSPGGVVHYGNDSFNGYSVRRSMGIAGDLAMWYLLLHVRHTIWALFFDLIIFGLLIAILRSMKQRNFSYAPVNSDFDAHTSFIHRHDRQFSEVVFVGFCSALFAKLHEMRATPSLRNLSSYFATDCLDSVRVFSQEIREVKGVVVASSKLAGVGIERDFLQVGVAFDANYTEVDSQGRERGWYVREEWTLERRLGAVSRAPEKMAQIVCPSCGSGLEKRPNGACSHCGSVVTDGRFDWFVTRIDVLERSERGPLLTGEVTEQGTDLPTVFAQDVELAQLRLQRADPAFSPDLFLARVAHIFLQIQEAWSQGRWEKARPYETDELFGMHSYWIAEYKKQNLRNVLEEVRVERTVVARVAQDAFFDAITVRIYASMKDYTVQLSSKEVVGGNAKRRRRFSEYWTFVRRRGHQSSSKESNHANCPSCGAALKINQAGICEYCASKITLGDFDWVLARIEQDEEYGA